jgi:hypothetical protein
MDELIALDRRETLRVSTGFLAGCVVAGSPLAWIARGRAWAIELTSFTTAEGATLLAATRTIMPHDKLEDAAYAFVVQALDRDADKSDGARKMMQDGIAGLGAGFAASAENERVAALKNVESSEFFQTLRLKTMQVLYSTPLAYSYFGYQGEAFTKGGYIFRGFSDLRWLPDVPQEDSGPMPVSR